MLVPGLVPVTVTVPASVTPGVVPTPVFGLNGVYPVGIWLTKSEFCVFVLVGIFSGTNEAPCINEAIPAAVNNPVAINVSRISVFAYWLALAASRTTCWPTGEAASRVMAVEATAAGAAIIS